ncbi:spindle and kinetochore-associated protein 3 [Cricetulus griseus]|uniref:Spindle and kinetochore-associated protein 3 n=1 Tax=Cricetulus griseus TaxID=10029 RepID=A0A061HZA9_CRIGR|nr:spindle and kinetochore-associated protein 3 [Cricetulus griseus]
MFMCKIGKSRKHKIHKGNKSLDEKNSTDIMKLREFFQKYGYHLRNKEDSDCEHKVSDSTAELAVCEDLQKPAILTGSKMDAQYHFDLHFPDG